MSFAPNLSRPGRIYLATTVGLGLLAIGESLFQLYRVPLGSQGLQWLLLAVLTLVSGSASVELPQANVSISISEAFVFTAVLLYGPAAGTLTVALDGLVISFWVARRRPELHRALFNIAAPALSAWCSAHLFFRVAGIAPLAQEPATVDQILPPLVLFALAYFGLNSWLIALVISFQRRVNPLHVWRSSFLWLSLNYFCGASVAMLLVGYNRTIDLRFVAVVVPLLLVLYFTFKTSTQRVEDANRHVDTLNALYLSTIETLAMAIDAKDQVTHGHIRRVQSAATRLARDVGVRDDKLIKAIEAAALLHDMGKLAVPEYILNKPGKLTEAEFAKMKLHASVGADILSAIDFPYPVVPIVRHHHENWDGTGYPAGLRGTDIPIGARILSVVDCFDALTSDRPYRPKLPDAEALKILTDRRGSMYDPLIVDTFTRIHASDSLEPIRKGPPSDVLNTIAKARQAPPGSAAASDDTASTAAMLELHDMTRALSPYLSVSETGNVVAQHLRGLVPSSLIVIYLYDERRADIEARCAIGDGALEVRGIRIPVGQRLSGWVAANHQTISNSDPTLDLRGTTHHRCATLRSCLSAPILCREELVGVLTVYSVQADAFTENHRRVVELVARQISYHLRLAAVFADSRLDSVTGLPYIDQLDKLIDSTKEASTQFGMLFVKPLDIGGIDVVYGDDVKDDVLRYVADHVRHSLRPEHLLFRTGDELVAFINATDIESASVVAKRIGDNIAERPLTLGANDVLPVEIDITIQFHSADGKPPRTVRFKGVARDSNVSARPESQDTDPTRTLRLPVA